MYINLGSVYFMSFFVYLLLLCILCLVMTSGLLLIAEMLCKLPEGTTLRSYLFIIFFLLLNRGVKK